MSTSHFIVWICADTVHAQELETVLRTNEQDPGDLSISLVSMVEKEFSKNPNIKFHEYDLYGSLTYSVSVDKIENIQRVLDRCDKVNQRWINKHRINGMQVK